MTPKKVFRPREIREWQRKRTQEWRERYLALGLTYRKVNGHWGWAPRKRVRASGGARIHISNPAEIERIRKKIAEAMKKSGGG